MKEDVICAILPKLATSIYCYENEKLVWLVKNQLEEIMRI